MRTRRDQRLTTKPARQRKPSARDIQIVLAVYRYRVLRQDQLYRLFFASPSTGKQVLRRLFHQGYLARKFIDQMMNATYYILDTRGVELLRAQEGLEDFSWYASNKNLKTEFLEHTCAINDVRITIAKTAPLQGLELLKWVGESELKADYDRVTIRTASGKQQAVSLIPDGYFALQTPKGIAHIFLELDRGTTTSKRFRQKIVAYQTYHQTGGYERRYGAKNYRVMTVTTSEKRLQTLKAATEDVNGRDRFWFTTLQAVTEQSVFFVPIWFVAGRKELWPLIS
jgi:hypothetical protein